jgi:hypothetical protein
MDKNDTNLRKEQIQEGKEKKYTRIQKYMINILEVVVKKIFFWENDEKRIGKLIRFLHHASMYLLAIMLILAHTVFPSYILLFIVYVFCLLIWIQHIVTGGCIVSKLEQKLIGDKNSFVDPILEAFHIPITEQTTVGITILGSTCVLLMMTLELSARTILSLKSYFSFFIKE